MDNIKQFTDNSKKNLQRISLLSGLAERYEQKGLYKRALKCYEKILEIDNTDITYKVRFAKMFSNISNHNQAINLIHSPEILNTNDGPLLMEIALIYEKGGLIQEAINCLKKAIQIDGKDYKYYLQLANLFYKEGLIEEAIACYKTSIFYESNDCIVYNNLGIALKDNHHLDESLECFKKALILCPNDPYIHWNYSQSLLISGNFREGFAEYEWRLIKPDYKQYVRHHNKPHFKGKQSTGSTLLIYAEQGLGDTLQFVRYLKPLKEKGYNVIFQCHRELKSLFLGEVYDFEDSLPDFDMQCPLLSLPYIFNTDMETIPADIPYLSSTAYHRAKWKDLVGLQNAIKVGLVWAGSPAHPDDRNRSMDISFLKPLLSLKGFTFYSLQIGSRSKECEMMRPIIDLTKNIHDFADTAGFIDNLDIIISVDTATAHLSGAMGKKTWLLLPFTPDWRWMLHIDVSPWYPTMRLFRQKQRGDWAGVIKEVLKECNLLRY